MNFNTKNYFLNISKKTHIMGILNITPDSFSDGNKFFNPQQALNRAIEIENEGADILDIGAQSTRPNFKKISSQEEWNRLKNILSPIRKKIKIPISIDTFYPEIAEKAISLGVDIINDVTGFSNNNMFEIAKNSQCGCIITHNKKNLDILNFFKNIILKAKKYNLDQTKICFDPGIGFGKTFEQNLFIINNLKSFIPKSYPILIGASLKRVIGLCDNNPPFEDRLYGTIAAHTLAIANGANIIRVHDVKEAIKAAKVADKIIRSEI